MIKKILYLDLETLKGLSAQLYKGNMLSNEVMESESEGARLQDDFGSTEEKSNTFNAGFEGIAGYKGTDKNVSIENKEIEESSLKTYQETKRIAYDDYLANLVQTTLKESDQMKTIEEATMYDYVALEDKFDFYDFENTEKSLDYTMVIPFRFINGMIMTDYEELYKQYKSNKNSKHKEKKIMADEFEQMLSVKTMFKLSEHINHILGNNFLLMNKKRNIIIIGNKDNLKLPSIALTLTKTIKINTFGLVLSKENQRITDDFNHDDPHEVMRNMSSFSLENYLVNFFGFDKHSEIKIIHPISIEYSAD